MKPNKRSVSGRNEATKPTREWMLKAWGEKCKTYQIGCSVCDAWKCFNFLTAPSKCNNPIHEAHEKALSKAEKAIIKGTDPWCDACESRQKESCKKDHMMYIHTDLNRIQKLLERLKENL